MTGRSPSSSSAPMPEQHAAGQVARELDVMVELAEELIPMLTLYDQDTGSDKLATIRAKVVDMQEFLVEAATLAHGGEAALFELDLKAEVQRRREP